MSMHRNGRCIAYLLVWLVAAVPASDSRAARRAPAPAPAPAVKATAPVAKVPAAKPTAPEKVEVPARPEPAAEEAVADKWALIIGISKFKDSSMNLKYPAKD